ncbi:CHAT domain-containing protein [Aetokthonos hydrillicola Thurmond2011]|uniref:CHAT domain-containing protein n=1 Tax=Aetokthonos hydrillicola Thurmond2011 TaxID=2712845 RepID=A0AAP5I614_9CYAN|nr:CHAT domain-containing protein [Aetokthonos hydrillicola Thurmond2011]
MLTFYSQKEKLRKIIFSACINGRKSANYLQIISKVKKILILSANPKNTNHLRLDEEVRGIQAALKQSQNREQFQIVTFLAVRVEDLRRALLEHQPTIVHFSGHGSGTEGLALENNSGQMQLVSTESLARLFGLFQSQIECVFLNACYSQAQAEAIHQHIDYLVGMNQAIGDVAAIEFAIGFYDALFAGRPYEECFEVGRASIDLQGIPEYSTPQLKARQRSFFHLKDNIKEGKQSELESKLPQTMTQERPPQSIVINGGSHSGQIGQAGNNLNQNQSNTQGSLEEELSPIEIVELIEKIQSLFNYSDLPDKQKKQALKHIDYAKDAVQEEKPDKNTAATSLQKATQTLKEANETLGAGQGIWQKLEPIAKQLAPWLGIAVKSLVLLP